MELKHAWLIWPNCALEGHPTQQTAHANSNSPAAANKTANSGSFPNPTFSPFVIAFPEYMSKYAANMCEDMLVSLGFHRHQVQMGIRLQQALQKPVTCADIAMVIKKTPQHCSKQVQLHPCIDCVWHLLFLRRFGSSNGIGYPAANFATF